MGFFSKVFGGGEKVYPERIDNLRQYKDQVIDADVPVIMNVTSPTCAPCQRLAPVLVEVATKYDGKVRVAIADTSTADPRFLGSLGVRATPTLIIYHQGEELGRMTGFRPKGWFDEMIRAEFSGG